MPLPVLEQMQHELLDYRGRGLSVLEMSHRSAEFADIAQRAETSLRTLLAVPNNYKILFMQGGATAQFALCVQNLDHRGSVAYSNTGQWSNKAIKCASSLTSVREVTRSVSDPLTRIPDPSEWDSSAGSSFLHITDNETIDGVVFNTLPNVDVSLVADMSSSILSRPIDISRYGMIYAGAQKNIGPSGITLIIIRDDLLERSALAELPAVFNYAAMASANSLLNTPPTFAWYAAGLVFDWLLAEGGLSAIAQRNQRQASRLYTLIDESDFYINQVHPDNRSWMNIPFQLKDASLSATLIDDASSNGFIGLKGHKSVGGLRASIYNAALDEDVEKLAAYLTQFARDHA